MTVPLESVANGELPFSLQMRRRTRNRYRCGSEDISVSSSGPMAMILPQLPWTRPLSEEAKPRLFSFRRDHNSTISPSITQLASASAASSSNYERPNAGRPAGRPAIPSDSGGKHVPAVNHGNEKSRSLSGSLRRRISRRNVPDAF